MVVYFEAEKETVLQRSLGRRLDPETEKSYHLDTNRPPYDVVCKERLLMPVDPCNPAGGSRWSPRTTSLPTL